MPTVTKEPTSVSGTASGQTVTGHGATTSSAGGGTSQTKTCTWSAFPASGGQVTSLHLKLSWTVEGSLQIVNTATNAFTIDYSVDNGSNWTNALTRLDVGAPDSGSIDVTLGLPQDLTLVRVRDSMDADTTDPGDIASITASVSSIRLELETTAGGNLIAMM